MNARAAARHTGVTTYDESKHARDGAGKFTTKDADSPGQIDLNGPGGHSRYQRGMTDVTETPGILTVDNPDDPTDQPIFDGEPSNAVARIVPGTYPGLWASDSDLEAGAEQQPVSITVTDDGRVLVSGGAAPVSPEA